MIWITFIPTLVVAALVLFLPGAALSSAFGLRGFARVALSAPLSVSLIAVASIVSGAIGVPWSFLDVAALTVAAVVVAVLWSRWRNSVVPRRRVSRRRDTRELAFALGLSLVFIGALIATGMRDPDFFSQRYDNFFHLNAIRYVLDTGNASPFWIGTMTSPDGTLPFYPSAWHAVVSLVVSVSGASVVQGTNAVILVVAAAVWPASCIFLVRSLFGRSRTLTVVAGAIAGAFTAFPYLPLHYGVLYPLFLGLACAPAALGVVWMLVRPGVDPRRSDHVALAILLVPGIAVAHPGALLAVLALSLPMVVAAFFHKIRAGRARARVLWSVALAAYLGAGLLALHIVRPPADQIYWPTIESIPAAIGSVVSASVYGYPVALLPAVLMIAGIYSVVRRPSYVRWVALASSVVGAVLYIVVAASTSESLRNLITGPWYNNAPRLASIWVIGALPVAALGAISIVRWVMRSRAIISFRRRVPVGRAVGLGILGLALVAAAQGPGLRQAGADIEYTYAMRTDAPIVTPDEYRLMEELGTLVPPGDVVAGDPYTGASFAYALSGRKVLMPHLLMQVSADTQLINARFSTEGDDPQMCRALANTGVRYILDFSAGGDFMKNNADFSGLDGLAGSPYVSLAAVEGGARLYRITSCGFGS